MKISDRVTGIFLVLLGLAAGWVGSRLPPVPGQQIGPSVFPMVVGAGLILLGAMIALHIGRTFEDEAEAEVLAHGGIDPEEASYARSRRWLVLLPPALLVFYYLASERMGFLITAMVMISVLALAFNASRRMVLPLALGGALFIQLVFVKVLRVPLAPLPFELPW